MIPFRIKKLTDTAKAPTQKEGILWDLYVDDFELFEEAEEKFYFDRTSKPFIQYKVVELDPQGRILIKTGISLELPTEIVAKDRWAFKSDYKDIWTKDIKSFAVAEIKSRSDNLEQKGLFIENKIITGGEISFVVINHGHEEITIEKGEPIAKMLIKPVYPSKMEETNYN